MHDLASTGLSVCGDFAMTPIEEYERALDGGTAAPPAAEEADQPQVA